MDSVFQMPGHLSKAWLFFTELSATLYNQQLERWFSELHWRSGSNSNFSKKFPFEKSYGEILPVYSLETTFSSSEIFLPVWYSSWIVQKLLKYKTFWKQLSRQMSWDVHDFDFLSENKRRRFLNSEQGHQLPPPLGSFPSAHAPQMGTGTHRDHHCTWQLLCPLFSRSAWETQVQHPDWAHPPHSAQTPLPGSFHRAPPSKPGVTALCLSPMWLKRSLAHWKVTCSPQINSLPSLDFERNKLRRLVNKIKLQSQHFKPLQFLPAGSSRAHTLTPRMVSFVPASPFCL